MKARRIKYLFCVAFIFLLIVSSFTVCAISQNKSISSVYKENINGNIINSGIACTDKEWIYYSLPECMYYETCDLNKIYRIKLNGSKMEKLNDDPSGMLNSDKDWVYYRNISAKEYGSIYKISKDGKTRVKITAPMQSVDVMPKGSLNFWLSNDRIIYLDIDTEAYSNSMGYLGEQIASKIYSIGKDGKNKKLLLADTVYAVNVSGNYIFYTSIDKKDGKVKLYKINISNAKKSVVAIGNISKFIVEQDKVYFIKAKGEDWSFGNLFVTNGATTSNKICDNVISFNIDQNSVYVGIKDKGLYKISKSGNKKEKISKDNANYININVVQNWLYSTLSYPNRQEAKFDFIKMSTDGTSVIRIDNVFNNNVYKNPKLFYKLYEKFNCKYLKGSFNYPKTWFLYYDFPTYPSVDAIPVDERCFSTYDQLVTGVFGFYNKKDQDKYSNAQIKESLNIKTADIVMTNKGIKGYCHYDKNTNMFIGYIPSGQYIFSIRVRMHGIKYDILKNILIDMLKGVNI